MDFLFDALSTPLEAGLNAVAKRKWKRARDLLEGPAVQGERLAAYHLGLMCWRGQGGPRDPEAAVFWLERAASLDLPQAQDALGSALYAGLGAEKNDAAARTLFEAAAARGYPPAMTHLAPMCDPAAARTWLGRAADAGYAPAFLDLSFRCERDEPIEALALLYAHAALTGAESSAVKAKSLARDLAPGDIAAAQKKGRRFLKQAQAARKTNAHWRTLP